MGQWYSSSQDKMGQWYSSSQDKMGQWYSSSQDKIGQWNSSSKIIKQGDIEIRSTNLLWKITNYSKLPRSEWIRSPEFTIAGLAINLEFKRELELKLRLNGVESTPRIWCNVGVMDMLGTDHFTATKVTTVKKSENEKVFWTVKENDLYEEEFKFIPDDTLTINFKTAVQDVQPLGESTIPSFLEKLSTDLGRFLDSKTSTDCILLADNTQFPAHRAVLAARSAVFEAIFEKNTQHGVCQEVEIQDVQPHEVEEMLHYIYTGKIPKLTADTAFVMYELAEKYALPELKEECIKLIIPNLTIGNVCAAALLAATHNIEPLRRAVVGQVQSKLNEVLDSDQWKSFSVDKRAIANNLLYDVLTATKTKFNI